MWKAQIADKSYINGVISVTINYTDENNDFGEIVHLTAEGELENRIDTKLKQLARQDTVYASITKGDFIEEKPPEIKTSPPI